MNQTGLHLVPVDNYTYDTGGSKHVRVVGGEDKRQITVCVASSLHGDLLPLQLIFTGGTERSLPPHTPETQLAGFHLTHSDNHWSNQETMQQYILEIIVPYTNARIGEHGLQADAKVVLVLDVWSVHKSATFITFLKEKHPNILLVFVPPNCTSQLQVADVVLQRPFKHGIKKQFNNWAASKISEQILVTPFLKMKTIKPLVLQWCLESWTRMKEGSDLIKEGWKICCVSLFDVYNQQKRQEAVAESARGSLELKHVPKEDEPDNSNEVESESDDDQEKKDELDVMKERCFGERKSNRKRKQTKSFGFGVNPSQIDMCESGEDSDADGIDKEKNKKKTEAQSKKKQEKKRKEPSKSTKKKQKNKQKKN